MITQTALAVLILISLISGVSQIPFIRNKVNQWDITHLVPNYSFFAPKPMTCDYRIVYRTEDAEDSWHEVGLFSCQLLQRIFCNSERYYIKGFIDSCNSIVQEFRHLKDDQKNYIQFSVYYLNLLLLVCEDLKVKNYPENSLVRFAVVSTEHNDDIRINGVQFISLKHQIL